MNSGHLGKIKMRDTLANASFKRWDKRNVAAHDWHMGLRDHIRRNQLPPPQERTALWRSTVLTEELIDRYAARVPKM